MFSDVWNCPDNVLLNSVANIARVCFNSSSFDMTGGTQAPAPLDPRTLGEGPCGQHHQVPEVFQCNQHACWRRCQRCSLRLEYHAKLNATGTSRSAGHTPDIIRRALDLVHEANIGRDGMTCKKMDGFIKIAEGERMAPAGGAPRPRLRARHRMVDETAATARMVVPALDDVRTTTPTMASPQRPTVARTATLGARRAEWVCNRPQRI